MSTQKILKKFDPRRENLLLILHDLQDNHPQNYLTEDALDHTAKYLKLTKSSVYGVATYYSMFSVTPRGRHIIRVCASPVCELLKSETIIASIGEHLGIKTGETTPDGLFTLELSECLGQCQDAPSMMIDKTVYSNLTTDNIREVLDAYRQP
ncbi:MAG: NAD(P)H-dependent oxidoreductase subunit E [Bacteroidales bacterium]